MTTKKISALAFGLLWLLMGAHAAITTNSNTEQFFRFKFELHKPLVYAFQIKTKTVVNQNMGGRNASSRTTSDVRYKIKLTAIKVNQDGTATVHYEPMDYEQDLEAIGPSGEINTFTRGLDIISKQNGITMIDTKNGIGLSQAKQPKLGLYPYLLSGDIDLDAAGKVTKLNGDVPFVDHWQEIIYPNPGFFQFTFPSNAIAIQSSWTNYIPYNSANGIVLNETNMTQTNIFTREVDSAANSEAVTNMIACFSLNSVDNQENLSGYLDQPGGRTSLVVPEHTENINATFHFDQKRGCLIDMIKTDKTTSDISMMIQGNAAMGHSDSDVDTLIKLVSPNDQ